jgi:ribose transport system ATP-binding protein
VLRDGKNAGSGVTATTANEAIVALMVGTAPDQLFPRSERRAGDPMLEVEGLGQGSATFALRSGEILGIAGLLGAGRTRLMRSIFGLEPVTSGRVRVGAYRGAGAPPEPWQTGMGLLSEDRKSEGLALGLSVADNLTMTRLDRFGPGTLIFPARQRAATARWIERLDIRCAGPAQDAAQLSGGNQQKIAIARLLHHDVDVLLLDEPTRGIDVGSKAQIYKLIDALVASSAAKPKAVLMVSSYLPELLGMCDRIAVMRRGRLEPAQPAASLTEHDLMMQATGAARSA